MAAQQVAEIGPFRRVGAAGGRRDGGAVAQPFIGERRRRRTLPGAVHAGEFFAHGRVARDFGLFHEFGLFSRDVNAIAVRLFAAFTVAGRHHAGDVQAAIGRRLRERVFARFGDFRTADAPAVGVGRRGRPAPRARRARQ